MHHAARPCPVFRPCGDDNLRDGVARARRFRGEGSVVGLQLRVRFVRAALLAMLRLHWRPLQFVSKARDWTGHVDR